MRKGRSPGAETAPGRSPGESGGCPPTAARDRACCAGKYFRPGDREAHPPGDFYADAVRKYLDERYGAETVETQGLQVDVAMEPRLQRAAEASVDAALRAVDKRQGWRGPVLHLEPAQRAAALPAWRERLKAAQEDARPGEVLVWDLAFVNPDDIEPGEELTDAIKLMKANTPASQSFPEDLNSRADELFKQIDTKQRESAFLKHVDEELKEPSPGKLAALEDEAKQKGYQDLADYKDKIDKAKTVLRQRIVFFEEAKPAAA